MHVALIVETTFPPESRANLRLYRLGLELTKNGKDVLMFSPSYLPWNKKNIAANGIRSIQYLGFYKYLYSKIRTVIRFYHCIATVIYLIFYHLKNGIKVIHAWNPLAGLAAVIAGKILHIPVYLDFTDFYSDIASVGDMPKLANVLFKIELYTLKNAQKVIVVSNVMVERLINFGIEKNKLFVIPDGTNASKFRYSESGRNEIRDMLGLTDEPTLIYHGDIKQLDGVDILFDCFQKIIEKIPKAKLLVLGGGGEYFKQLKESIKDKGFYNSIIFTGWVEHSEVPKYISAADVGAMTLKPTINHECYLSFKLFEYWGCARPVVLTKLKAISQIMEDGIHGIQVEFGDIDGYVNAFVELLLNKDKAKQIGANGRKLVEEKFDWSVIMQKEAALYN